MQEYQAHFREAKRRLLKNGGSIQKTTSDIYEQLTTFEWTNIAKEFNEATPSLCRMLLGRYRLKFRASTFTTMESYCWA